jgi:hypothetical protein
MDQNRLFVQFISAETAIEVARASGADTIELEAEKGVIEAMMRDNERERSAREMFGLKTLEA